MSAAFSLTGNTSREGWLTVFAFISIQRLFGHICNANKSGEQYTGKQKREQGSYALWCHQHCHSLTLYQCIRCQWQCVNIANGIAAVVEMVLPNTCWWIHFYHYTVYTIVLPKPSLNVEIMKDTFSWSTPMRWIQAKASVPHWIITLLNVNQ